MLTNCTPARVSRSRTRQAVICTAALLALVTFGSWQSFAADEKQAAVEHVNPAEAAKLIADSKAIVLDLRTPQEFADGHIAGAVNIDFLAAGFEEKIAALDKSPHYVVHCASGNRSGKALPLLQKHAFESIYHLDGGFIAWQKAGLPVQK